MDLCFIYYFFLAVDPVQNCRIEPGLGVCFLLNNLRNPPTCGCLLRVGESLQRRGLFPLQETLSFFRVQPQLLSFVEDRMQGLRAKLPGRLLVLLGWGESTGQRRHERGGECHSLREALRQAGAEAALEAGDLRMRVVGGGESLL